MPNGRALRAMMRNNSFLPTIVVVVIWYMCGVAIIGRREFEEQQLEQHTGRSLDPSAAPWKPDLNQPRVDSSSRRDIEETLLDVKQLLPNLPIDYWDENRGKPMQRNSTCARLPSVVDLNYDNIYWQLQETSDGAYYFYGAYYDSRVRPALVRMLVMISRKKPTLKMHCHMWFSGKWEPVAVPVVEHTLIWGQNWHNGDEEPLHPFLMSCPIPPRYKNSVPRLVSVVENICDTSTVALRVINNLPDHATKQDFAVCVRGLSFPDEDKSVRLVEWLETISLLGAKKVFMYELEVHPNISKVLHYYQKRGLVDLTPISLAGGQPNQPNLRHYYLKTTRRFRHEVIPYNDCFYRNLNVYDYIALLDIDEVIMPIAHKDWPHLIDQIRPMMRELGRKNKNQVSAFNAQNVYFFDSLQESTPYKEMPGYMHMLQHVLRSRNYTESTTWNKCFFRTDRVIALHNHSPLACIGGCLQYHFNTSVAHLQHYRPECSIKLKDVCQEQFMKNPVLDTTIWRYKDELTLRTQRTLEDLDFLPKPVLFS